MKTTSSPINTQSFESLFARFEAKSNRSTNAHLTCDAPDEASAQNILDAVMPNHMIWGKGMEKPISYEIADLVRVDGASQFQRSGAHLSFELVNSDADAEAFSRDLSRVVAYLLRQRCTHIVYKFYEMPA